MNTKTYLAIRNPTKTDVTIYAEYSHNRKVKRVPTGVRVPRTQWDNVTRTVTGAGSAAINKAINKVLATLEAQVQKLYLENGNVYPTTEQLAQQQNKRATQIQAVVTESPLREVMATWMSTKEDWAASTVRNFNTVLANIYDFERAHGTTWCLSKLQTEDIRCWQKWLKKAKAGKRQQGYSDSTLGKRVRLLRQFLRKHPAPGVDLNDEGAKAIHKVMLTTPFVLNQAELNAIELLPLSHDPRLTEIRDMLMLQAFCGLRYSDLSRLESRHITKSHITIQMIKSGAKAVKVAVPLVRQSQQVLAKYTTNGVLKLPLKGSQDFNRGIRAVCRMVPALHDLHTQDYRLHGKPMELVQKKYKFVTSHTLRRTFVSVCLGLGYRQKEVMDWSGHTTMAAFSRYVGASEQQASTGAEFDQRWQVNQQALPSPLTNVPSFSADEVRKMLEGLPLSADVLNVLTSRMQSVCNPSKP